MIKGRSKYFANFLLELEEMIEITGRIKAGEKIYKRVMNGIVVDKRETLNIMSKDLISQPIFEVLVKWLSYDTPDYIKNREHIYRVSIEILYMFRDIFGMKKEKK
jgi:hypothetical protein